MLFVRRVGLLVGLSIMVLAGSETKFRAAAQNNKITIEADSSNYQPSVNPGSKIIFFHDLDTTTNVHIYFDDPAYPQPCSGSGQPQNGSCTIRMDLLKGLSSIVLHYHYCWGYWYCLVFTKYPQTIKIEAGLAPSTIHVSFSGKAQDLVAYADTGDQIFWKNYDNPLMPETAFFKSVPPPCLGVTSTPSKITSCQVVNNTDDPINATYSLCDPSSACVDPTMRVIKSGGNPSLTGKGASNGIPGPVILIAIFVLVAVLVLVVLLVWMRRRRRG